MSRTASLMQLYPVAGARSLQRRPCATVRTLNLRKQSRGSYSPMKTTPLRKKILDLKVSDSYMDYRPTQDHVEKVEEHARKIELESLGRGECGRVRQTGRPMRLPRGEFDRLYGPNPRESRSRYREGGPIVQRSHTKSGLNMNPPEMAVKKVTRRAQPPPALPFKRLTLGTIDFRFSKLWEP